MMTLKEIILREAIKLARRRALYAVTRQEIASAAKAGTGTINYHFGSVGLLHDAVLAHAIETEDVEVLARLAGIPRIMSELTPALKERVADHIAGK